MDNALESPGAIGNGISLQDKGSGVRCRVLNTQQASYQGQYRLGGEGEDEIGSLGNGEQRRSHEAGNEYISPNTTVGTVETGDASNDLDNFLEAPKVGMVFSSWQDVELYYKEYAEAIGFGVSRVQGAYSRGEERVRISTTWRCECYGKPDMRAQREAKKRAKAMGLSGSGGVVGGVVGEDELSRSKRRSKKCECEAMIYASVNHDGQWEIKRVELEHSNHIPDPSLARLVKEYRMKHLTLMARKQLFTFFDQGVTVTQIHGCMAIEEDGTGSAALTVKDLQHEVYKNRRSKMEGGDSAAMMSFFQKMRERDVNFFNTQRLDDEGRLKDVLWVDARSRAAYEEFGDVVCFDATYLTNDYDLPFLNFVGVNHHGQSILLGCALVSHEDCDTFRWVFKHWLDCMNNNPPKSILTDQAAAMRKPLEEVMPSTRHRWCIWHIMRKIPEKLGKCERYKDFKSLLKRIVYESFTIHEFESGWSEFIVTFELQSNEWLNSLYKERHMWVPAFMKEYFWAGMKTTQRVESINSFFDGFLTRNTKLFEFPMKYEKALKKRIQDEIDADAKCSKYIRRLVSGFLVEKLFQKIYTDTKFQEVQTECMRMMYCFPRQATEVTDLLIQYVVEDRVWVVPEGKSEDVITERRRFYSATFNKETKVVCCDCRKFETDGIMCRHTIRILDLNLVKDIPDKYILARWRKDILRKHTRIQSSYHDPSKVAEVRRYKALMTAFEPICDQAAMVDDVTIRMVLESLEKIKSKVSECSKRKLDQTVPLVHPGDGSPTVHHSPGGDETTSPMQHPADSSEGFTADGGSNDNLLRDPVQRKRGRGRPKSRRFKGLSEIVYKKPRKQPPTKKQKKGGVNLAIPPRMVNNIARTVTNKPPPKRQRKTGGADLVAPPPRGKNHVHRTSNKRPSKKKQTSGDYDGTRSRKGKQPVQNKVRRGRSLSQLEWLDQNDILLREYSGGLSLNGTPLSSTVGPSISSAHWLNGQDSLLVDCSIDISETLCETFSSSLATGKKHGKEKATYFTTSDSEGSLFECSIDLSETLYETFSTGLSTRTHRANTKVAQTPSSSQLVWSGTNDSLVDCSIDLSETL